MLAVATPIGAMAATIDGLINITGDAFTIDLSDIIANGVGSDTAGVDVDFDPNTGDVTSATGAFTALAGSTADLFDIDFSAAVPAAVWTVGNFTFSATSYADFGTFGATQGFTAYGILTDITGTLDDTDATLLFSTQGNNALISFSTTTVSVPVPAGMLLMGTALAGFGVMRRRKKAA